MDVDCAESQVLDKEPWFAAKPSALNRLAAALFVRNNAPETRPMGFFTAYFDASGNAHRQPFVIVSGYIANFGQWRNFERQWDWVHSQFGVEKPFHMSAFSAASSQPEYKNQKNARADYVELARDQERAQRFLRAIAEVQINNVHCGISCIVNMSVYEEISSVLDLREVVPPYALGAQMCLERVRQWEVHFDVRDPVECIFESGDFEQGRLTELMTEEGRDPPIYKSKQDFPGLQGADHYAWEQYYALTHHLRTDFEARETLNVMLQAIPKRHTSPTRAMLVRLCERKGIDPRTGFKK